MIADLLARKVEPGMVLGLLAHGLLGDREGLPMTAAIVLLALIFAANTVVDVLTTRLVSKRISLTNTRVDLANQRIDALRVHLGIDKP